MKLSCVIFICPLVIASTMVQLGHTSVIKDECTLYEWFITNTTIKWKGDTKIITFYTTDNKGDCPIYTVQIEINGCTNRVNCTGQPKIALCTNNVYENISQSQLESDCKASAAKIACTTAKREKEQEWLTNTNLNEEELNKLVLCIVEDLDEAE